MPLPLPLCCWIARLRARMPRSPLIIGRCNDPADRTHDPPSRRGVSETRFAAAREVFRTHYNTRLHDSKETRYSVNRDMRTLKRATLKKLLHKWIER